MNQTPMNKRDRQRFVYGLLKNKLPKKETIYSPATICDLLYFGGRYGFSQEKGREIWYLINTHNEKLGIKEPLLKVLEAAPTSNSDEINGSDPRVLNGTIGVVFAISPPSGPVASISVRVENGNEYKFRQIRTNGRGALYWPFRPSYATTFHKVQGMTLRHVFIDTHHTMMDGMFYVGSSRVRAA
ncbi:hypothetical protein GCK72_009069 [Caenorhabditis remanei]|uniref:ATP-dependent DNA helicase n=1 Tax=Caenorhabditis remanei TaxID=31234 RepID=A0A6A5H1C3_CAERE|nr:hypothetical protein GCK72_009069 [Caenorhabditis remanei]KAF1760819.1 hypothetical protein GCK72_009069 [Caenorhabditis remanei]